MKKSLARIIGNIVLLFAIFTLNWWLILVLFTIFCFVFENPFELFIYFTIYYYLFGLPTEANQFGRVLTLLGFAFLIFAVILLQRRLRARSVKEVYYKD